MATGEWGGGTEGADCSLDEAGAVEEGGEPAILLVDTDMERGLAWGWANALLDEAERFIFRLAAKRMLETMSLAETDC